MLFVVAMSALFADIIAAQNIDGLRGMAGARLRVASTIDVAPITGRFGRLSDSALTLDTRTGPRTIPVRSIDRVDRSRGGHALRNAVLGALVGTAVGGTIGISAAAGHRRDCPNSYDGCGFDIGAFTTFVASTAAGFVGGAIIGAATGRERWETVFTGQRRAEPAR